MTSFTDNRNITFQLDVKHRDVLKIKAHLKDDEGKPLDLLELADVGALWKVFGSSQRMLDIVFLLCLSQIDEHFDENAFQTSYAADLALLPALRESVQKRKEYWFAAGIGPEQIPQITKAFKEALVNFTPDPRQRAALETVLKNQEELTAAQAERAIRISTSRKEKLNAELDRQAEREIAETSATELLKSL